LKKENETLKKDNEALKENETLKKENEASNLGDSVAKGELKER
jgi:hypothetical protein